MAYQDTSASKAGRERRRAARKAAVDALKAVPCLDCKLSYPLAVMCFHHLDPAAKEGTLHDLIRSSTLQRCLEEAAKCVVLCANCHITRHIELDE